MKTPSPDLFHLIRSLSAQEKKYFKQYAARYSEARSNTYMLLFDAITKQDVYDEAAIKAQFAKQDFVKQLSVAKNYLFEKLLDALMEMHADGDESLALLKMIGRFELLFRRNLIAPALAFYERAENMAVEKQSIALMPYITRQKNLMLARSETKFSPQEWNNNIGGALEHARILVNFLEYEQLSSRASMIFSNPKFGYDKKLGEELESIMANPLFESEECALSFKAWHYYSKTRYRYLHVAARHEECLAFLKSCISYMLKHYSSTTTWQVIYFRTQSDFMHISIQTRQFAGCPAIFSALEKMIAEKYYPLPIIRQTHFFYKLMYHAASGRDVDEAIKFWIDNQTYWVEIRGKIEIPTRHNIMYDVFRLYFRKRDWKNAIITFNELISQKTLNLFEAPARIYWLMLQYEIANLELLPNLTHNARDWFKKNKMMNPLEKVSLRFFDNISRTPGKKEAAALFKKLSSDVEALGLQMGNAESSVKYDLLEWAEAKAKRARD